MRVQIPAYCDAWIMGCRFGEIVSIREARPDTRAALFTEEPRRYSGKVEIARVKLKKLNGVRNDPRYLVV